MTPRSDRHNSNAEGQTLKTSALDLLAQRRDSLIQRARRALLAVLLERGEATIDDARAAVPLPAGIDPKAFGPVAVELLRAGIIAADGFARSTRPEAHARPVQRWILKDRAAALEWLRQNPGLPDSAGEGLLFDLNECPGAATPGL